MRLFSKKQDDIAIDVRTDILLDKMDKFLQEMQSVADRLVAKLEKDEKANGQ